MVILTKVRNDLLTNLQPVAFLDIARTLKGLASWTSVEVAGLIVDQEIRVQTTADDKEVKVSVPG